MQSDEPANPKTEIPKNEPPPEQQDTPAEIEMPPQQTPAGEPARDHAE